MTDEEYFMRPPMPIHLKKGANTVRLVMPPPAGKTTSVSHWAATFAPLLGSSEHPREVPGLTFIAPN